MVDYRLRGNDGRGAGVTVGVRERRRGWRNEGRDGGTRVGGAGVIAGVEESAAVFGAADAEVGALFLFPGPTDVGGHFGVGADGLDGAHFLGQYVDGEEGVKLAVTGGAELGGGAEFASGGAGDKVVDGVMADFPLAQFTAHLLSGGGAAAFSVFGGGPGFQLAFFAIRRLWIPAPVSTRAGSSRE